MSNRPDIEGLREALADGEIGIAALRTETNSLLDHIARLEREAAETDKVLADVAAKWEEMERCAYNICAHCKEPFERGEAMSLHAQECPRNPVVMLNTVQAERIAVLEAGLRHIIDDTRNAAFHASSLLAPSPPVTGETP